MDFAIIETGGKQYKFVPDTEVVIEKLPNKIGDKVIFDKVLMIVDGEDVKIGDPYLKGITLETEVVSQSKTKKIHVLRFRAKSRTRRHYGHRQQITTVSIKTTKKTSNSVVKPTSKSATKKSTAKTK